MSSLLILGGSGFVGSAICSSPTLESYAEVTSASRHPHDKYVDSIQSSFFDNVSWDVREKAEIPSKFDVIIHAATPASATLNSNDPNEMFDVIVQGMKNVIEFASRNSNPPTILFTSSGAVYGEVDNSIELIPEDWPGAVNPIRPFSAYAEGKRVAESLLSVATSQGICKGLIARMFAFSGVDLPMDRHFAIGNFVKDAVSTHTIQIRSDGSSIRSYMDQQDMANWLLRILEAGQTNAIYHVGSERSISIRDLAHLIAMRTEAILKQAVTVEVQGLKSPLDGVSRYVPSTLATRQALGVNETISLEESIDFMIHKAVKEYL
jgi:nucleoside-diphosphate-sugar epimerase